MSAWGFLFQNEGPGWSLCVELVPQWRYLLINEMSWAMIKTPLPPKGSWLGAELYLGIWNVNFFFKHLRKLNSPLGLSKVPDGED